MRYLVAGLIAFLAVVIQAALVDACRIGPIGFNLPAMVAVAFVFLFRSNASLAMVAAVGLLEDVLCPGRLGVAMAWYLLLGWGLLEAGERFDLRPLSRRIASTGVFAGLLTLGVATSRLAIGEPTVGFAEIAQSAAAVAICTAVAAIPFWLVASWSERTLYRRLAKYEV